MAEPRMVGMFRMRAMRRAAAPEDLDRLAPLVPPGGWLILTVVIAMTAAGLGWGVLGRVPVTVRGAGVVTSTPPGSASEAVLFVPFAEGRKVAAGMRVRLIASTAGDALAEPAGRVLSVSVYPPTRAEIQKLLGNEVLAGWFASRGPSLAVRVWLDRQVSLRPGTPLEAKFLVSELRPIALLWGRR